MNLNELSENPHHGEDHDRGAGELKACRQCGCAGAVEGDDTSGYEAVCSSDACNEGNQFFSESRDLAIAVWNQRAESGRAEGVPSFDTALRLAEVLGERDEWKARAERAERKYNVEVAEHQKTLSAMSTEQAGREQAEKERDALRAAMDHIAKLLESIDYSGGRPWPAIEQIRDVVAKARAR